MSAFVCFCHFSGYNPPLREVGRLGNKPNTWSLSLTVRSKNRWPRAPADADVTVNAFLCSGVSAREVLAAVEAVAALGIELTTSGPAIDDAEAEALALVLSTVTRLISLDLNDNLLGAAGAVALAPVLLKMTQCR